MKEIPPFLIRSSAANKMGSTGWLPQRRWTCWEGRRCGNGKLRLALRRQRRLRSRDTVSRRGPDCDAGTLGAAASIPRSALQSPGGSLDSVTRLWTPIVLVETYRLWLPVPDCCILGCLRAASLRLPFTQRPSRARRMVAVTSPEPTASLPFMCHQCVD